MCYIGNIPDSKGGTEDVQNRINMARTAYDMLKNIWKIRELSVETNIRIFNSNMKSIICIVWKHGKQLRRL